MLNLLDFRPLMLSDSGMASTDVLLLHTVGAAAGISAAALLWRSILAMRRGGGMPRGFTPIAALFTLSALARMARILCSWFGERRLFSLDLVVLPLIFFAILSVPLLLSRYTWFAQQAEAQEGERGCGPSWVAKVAPALLILLFLGSLFFGSKALSTLIAAGGCILAALLLWTRAASFRNLPLRRRGLLLFTVLTTAGLLGVSTNLLLASRRSLAIFDELGGAVLGEISMMLLVLGMMFVFASLRFADVILKRVVAIYLWLAAAFVVWKAMSLWAPALDARQGRGGGWALLTFAIVALALFLAPRALRFVEAWVENWVFETPDFRSLRRWFWEKAQAMEETSELLEAGEYALRKTLGLAVARVVAWERMPEPESLGAIVDATPCFLSPGSVQAGVVSPSADVLLPLFLDGRPAYWMALGRGTSRPGWTGAELEFAVGVVSALQTRLAGVLAEERRIERLTRESALREQVASAELRALRAQINPHFLFNSLNTIADLAVVCPEKAEAMTLRLAAVFRYVLVNADRQFTTLEEEIAFSKNYLEIEKERFEERLQIHFEIDASLLSESLPTLLLQPLIENAIKHGIGPRREGGSLTVAARRTDGGFEVLVADDGVGLAYDGQRQAGSGAHVGVENVRRRLETAYNGGADFALRPREGGGVEACIAIYARREHVHESVAG